MHKTLESGQWDRVGGWWDSKGQNEIDLVAINKETRKVPIGEVKINFQKFDEEKLRLRKQAFLKEQKLSEYEVNLSQLSVEDMLS